jgi:2-phospho-L-lactate guanylyltransferase
VGRTGNNGAVTPTPPPWTILVPVKATSRGKSRIDLPADVRGRLAMAMAMDTVSAAAQCGGVLAIVEDAADGEALAQIPGVLVHLTAVSGLNESILDGLKVLSRDRPSPIAVLPGDLPGALPAELAAALEKCGSQPFSVVPDHSGVGTTLLTATEIGALRPRYGVDSFRRHQDAGAIAIDLPDMSGLRWDVDVVTDLDHNSGPRTRAILDSITADGNGR